MKSDTNTDNTAGSDCQERLVRLLPCPFCGFQAKTYCETVTCSNPACKMHFAAVPDMHTPEEWNQRSCDTCDAYTLANEQLRADLRRLTRPVKIRKAFVCVGCDFVYCDEPPTSCDCMNNPPKFIEGEIRYSLPNVAVSHGDRERQPDNTENNL
jgi:hypothetical protein